MSSNNTHSQEKKNVSSSIVSNLVNSGVNNVGATQVKSSHNKYLENNKSSHNSLKVIIGSTISIILIIIVIVIILLNPREDVIERKEEPKEESLYEVAYDTMHFEENKDLNKLYCSKKVTTMDDTGIDETDIRIYYFNDNDIETVIYHSDLIFDDDSAKYYDEMYNEYDNTLEANYSYDNVDTNLTKGTKRILSTVIIYTNREGELLIAPPNFVNYEAAKKANVDDGYTCN